MSAAPGLLFIVNSLGLGGAEKQVTTLLNHLDPERFRLHLAYLKRSERLLPELDAGRLRELVCCDVVSGLERHGVNRLASLIRTQHIDAIVCTNTYSMMYGYLARRLVGGGQRPKLATVFHTTLMRTHKEKMQMLLYRQLFKRTDLLLYVCENQRDYWREHGLRAAADGVVHNGIDVDYFSDRQTPEQKLEMRRRFGFTPEDYIVGLCSSLRPEKAHGDLLQALARLRAQAAGKEGSPGSRAKALFIGDGTQREAIESQIRDLGLREHVAITGMQQDVRPFISCCDAMTLVSHTVETFSLAALESMALGKPLVMSDIGGASEQIVHGETGYLFEPGDIEALAGHLRSLHSPALRTRMGSAANRRVRQLFTVSAMTSGFTAQIATLLAGGRLPFHVERAAPGGQA
jgi:glycosyltransferase involved in cell wall biosynthesis